MIYDLDIALVIRRYAPVWFRHAVNLQFAFVLCAWIARRHVDFLGWRERFILGQYRYNGLIHSLEWCLNDGWDTSLRRIYITVADQVPVMYHHGDGDPATVSHGELGQLTGYYHLADGDVSELYRYELLVNIPVALAVNEVDMFSKLDLYRFAGRRPALRYFDTSNNTVRITYYEANEAIFNQP